MSHRIHVFGASGSGTTTLARAVAERLQLPHFDADDYFWERTDPPFTRPYAATKRTELLTRDLNGIDAWVLSGSMCGWGDPLIEAMTLAVYVWIPADLRLARLAARERTRYGARIEPEGDMHAHNREFIEWAARYDTAGLEQRSRRLHERWMTTLACPVLRIEGDAPTALWVDRILGAIAERKSLPVHDA